jgi:EAL domain-containing protein (putative c-di-GMP-specific phosphodiesterase class I)
VNVAVNVSVIQLMQEDFLDSVTAILSASGLTAERVTIEMTESFLITDSRQIIARLKDFRNLGMGVSLDDFGTGNTSLTQLYDLPITEVKIDQSFIHKDGPTGAALINGIIDLAHSIGISVVTEGIETASQMDIVRQLGSDRVQGYHIARAMDHGDLVSWLGIQP